MISSEKAYHVKNTITLLISSKNNFIMFIPLGHSPNGEWIYWLTHSWERTSQVSHTRH